MAAEPRPPAPGPEPAAGSNEAAAGSNEAAIAHAIQSVTASTQALVRDQVELAKLEVQSKAATFGQGAAVGVAAGGFVLGALTLILQGFAWLAWYLLFPRNQFFWGFFLTALVLLLLAAVAGYAAYRALRKARSPVPEQAITAARETQATIHDETALLKEQVREVVVKPEDQRT